MSKQETINGINKFVETELHRVGFTTTGTVSIQAQFTLSNYDNNSSNHFKVASKAEALEIIKAFGDTDNEYFKDSLIDESKPIYLGVNIEFPR